MTMTKERRQFSAEEKVAILRKQLVEKRPISDVCDECGIRPTQFYQWQKTLFEGGSAAFDKGHDSLQQRRCHNLEQKISRLESKLAGKDEVIAEIMASHVQLKKSLGQD
jgi:transposase-like protein